MSSVRFAALTAIVGCASLWSAAAGAQVFRIIGPDGRVTFTDRPPLDARASPAPSVALPAGGGGSPASALPAEVRAVAGRFPVTIYTNPECGPCTSARSFLVGRGVPFTEKTVTSNEDYAALQRMSGAATLPFATIGGQHVRGFSDAEWSQYLDAAGYPKTSQLPPSYRNPPPSPLVALQPPPAPANGQQQQQQQPGQAQIGRQPRAEAPTAPSDPSPANPAGIRF